MRTPLTYYGGKLDAAPEVVWLSPAVPQRVPELFNERSTA